jgi:hypothetical protein
MSAVTLAVLRARRADVVAAGTRHGPYAAAYCDALSKAPRLIATAHALEIALILVRQAGRYLTRKEPRR